MTRISNATFENCTGVTGFKVYTGDETYTISDKIPDSIQYIENRAFAGCVGLTSVQLPAKLKALNSYAFQNCTNLERVIFVAQCPLTNIASYAFYNCRSLTTIELPDNLTTIGERALSNCIALTSLEFGPTVRTFGDGVFANCVGLEQIIFHATDMTFGSLCLNGCPQLLTAGPIGGDYDIQFAWTDKIPDRVFSSESFGGVALKTITIPYGIKTIGERAFSLCSELTAIQLPNSLEYIDGLAFFLCINLTSLKIPSSVKSISYRAFENCSGLRRVEIWMPSSEEKVANPQDGWFVLTSMDAIDLHIPRNITPQLAPSVYGPYWNCHSSGDGYYNLIPFTNDLG
jgi:hypothetical protein